ncbi:MAG: DUF2269 family protein [Deltaproteobacteria bacterium]|jgi:hypothetical protein|nr:DUF2269 family protein [Deltaproteobacteria bacterium]
MKIKGKTGRGILKITHIFFSSLWVGGAIAVYLMTLFLGPGVTGEEAYGYALAAKFVDDLVIVPGALGSLVSGVLICSLTGWGFFKHPFVAVKLVLTVLLVLSGVFFLGPHLNAQPELIAGAGLPALEDDAYRTHRFSSILGGSLQILALLFTLSISTLKPWGKKGAKTEKKEG